jgi:2,4-dienoyl-CoA reductase-like NADH-dependent reductase (Old Yellow Enzyme family)
MAIESPVRVGSVTIRNRLYRAPVLEGAGDGPEAAERYSRHFVENARHGVGLIIQGSSCISVEGRTSPGMTCLDTRAKVLRLRDMVGAVHREGASIFVQLGHGGIYAMEGWHEPYAGRRRGPLLAASPVPWLLRPAFAGVPVHVMTTDEVDEMVVRYAEVAAWAREAGYDGIQLGSANAKLLDQFLSPFYNRRTDRYGGSFERRASVLARIRAAVAERAGEDFPCTVKVPAETAPPGFRRSTHEDAVRLAALCEDWGFDAVTPVEVSVFPDTTLSRGAVPDSFWSNPGIARRLHDAAPSRRRRAIIKAGARLGGRRAPFRPIWNRELFRTVKSHVTIPVFAVGGIRTGHDVRAIVDRGDADLVGIGRPFYAEPDLARRVLTAGDEPGLCRNSNRCVPAQMLGMRGVCYNPAVITRVD